MGMKPRKKPQPTKAERRRFYRITLQDAGWAYITQFCVARHEEGVREAESEGFVCHLMPKGFEMDNASERLLEAMESDEETYHPLEDS